MSSVEKKTQTTSSSAVLALSKEDAANFKATYLGNDKSKAVARLTWLKVHTDLLSNNDVKDKGIRRLLEKLQLTRDEKQCESQCTLGHWVAWTDGKEATQQLLLLFKTIAEIKSSPYQTILVALLQRQDKDGWTLALLVARNRDAQSTLAVLNLLVTLAEKHPKEVLAILVAQTQRYGLTFAHMVARYLNAQSTQAVLNLLVTLAKKHPKNVLAILAAQDQSDWTLAHTVARYRDTHSTQAILTLLKTLAETYPKNVLAILAAQDQSDWTLAHTVARYRDAQSTLAVLTLLATLAETYPKEVLAILAVKDHSGWTLAHIVARYQDAQSMQAFLTLLESTISKTTTAVPENSEAKKSKNNVSAVQKKMRSVLAREISKYDGDASQDTLFDLLFKNPLLKEVDQTSIIYDMLKKGYMPTTSLKSLAKKEGMTAAIEKHILALQQSDPKKYKSARASLKKGSQLLAFFTEGGIDLKNKESSVFQLFPPMLASSPLTSKSSMFSQGIEMSPLKRSLPLRGDGGQKGQLFKN